MVLQSSPLSLSHRFHSSCRIHRICLICFQEKPISRVGASRSLDSGRGSYRVCSLDDASAQEDLLAVPDRRLAGHDGLVVFGEVHADGIRAQDLDPCRDDRLLFRTSTSASRTVPTGGQAADTRLTPATGNVPRLKANRLTRRVFPVIDRLLKRFAVLEVDPP